MNNKRILFTHGDKWDSFTNSKPMITEIASKVYYVLQKLDRNQKLTRKLKRTIKTWHGAAQELTVRIAKYCSDNKYDAVCFGHTHVPKHSFVDGIECVNLGSQCELPVTYAMIQDDGTIEINKLE